MKDLIARREKLLIEAEDCDLIGKLAADAGKRELFLKLAEEFRTMANQVEVVIADHKPH
jgi:hypothetical protein